MHLISDELAHQLGLKEANSGRGRSTHRSGSDSSSDSSPSPCPRKMKKAWKMWHKCHHRYGPPAFAPGPADPSQMASAPIPAFHPGFYPGGRRFWKMCPEIHVHLNSSPAEVAGHGMKTMFENAPSKDGQPGRPVTTHGSKNSSSDAQFVAEEIPHMIESVLKNSASKAASSESFSQSEIEELLSMSLGDLLKLKAQAKASSPLI